MNRTRRQALGLVAALPLLAASRGSASAAATAQIERLIQEARDLPHVGQRMDYISGKLLGVRYRADTLVGSPTRPEQFVVRDDAFDCMTYCEVVLAAALARDLAGFEAMLRRIRYDQGRVRYDERNHYFADWCQRNIANGTCQPVAIEPSVTMSKTVTWHREFGRHRVAMTAIAKSTMLASGKLLAAGDIIGILSARPALDYYHTGLIAFGRNGQLSMRHASLSHGRVVEETMTEFAAANPVRYVTLLRAAESTPMAERH